MAEPTQKPINPETGTTETTAEREARLAKNAPKPTQWVYYVGKNHNRMSNAKFGWYKKNKATGQVIEVADKQAERAIGAKAYSSKLANYQNKFDKKGATENKKTKEKNIATDYVKKKNTYVNLIKMYGEDGGGVVTPQQIEKARKDAEQARQVYIKTYNVDPASPDVDPNAPTKPADNKSLDDKAKTQSLENTTTITTGGDISLLKNIGLIAGESGDTGYVWNGNGKGTDLPIALVGDTNGKYVGAGIVGASEAAFKAGSPVGFQDYLDRIIQRYSSRSGGISELKEMLYNKNAYGSDRLAGQSMRYGDELDPHFRNALYKALLSTSNANYRRLMQNKNKKNVSFIDFESYLKTGGKLPTEAEIGEGANGTIVTRQTFKPEEYEIAIDQLFQATVGRGATDKELNDFLGKLRSYESANPQTTVVSGSETTSETSTVSGGVDQGVVEYLGREQALAAPDAEKNAYNKYFNYVLDAMNTGIELDNG
jgi:hypothetical protein